MSEGLTPTIVDRRIENKKNAKKNCRTLYSNKAPAWECGIGWTEAIAKLSYKIECLNRIFMRNFRVHAEVDQIKEKFGGLRFYYTVFKDPPYIIKSLCGFLSRIKDAIMQNCDFKMKSIIVKPASTKTYIKEIGPEDSVFPGYTVIETPDEDFKCVMHEIHSYAITKRIPSRNKFIFRLGNACKLFSNFMHRTYMADLTRQQVGTECLTDFIDSFVNEAEKECHSTCEECGIEIGTEYSPRCQTIGWIKYICEQCAKKTGYDYIKNNKVFNKDGVFVKNVSNNTGSEDCGKI